MKRPDKNQNGIALILVLWVLVLLIALGTEFAFSMRTEVNTTRNYKEDIESYYLAKAGINLAMMEIVKQSRFHSWSESTGWVNGIIPKPGEERTEDASEFEVVERENMPLGKGSFTYSITDENGKININTASREILIKVLSANGIEIGSERDAVADSILDWLDKDDKHRVNGAENEYYESLSPPYKPKNAPLNSLDELLEVKGVTKEILYGSTESEDDPAEKIQYVGLDKYFTTYNVRTLNPNTASREVLSVMFNSSKAEEIIQAKNEKGYYATSLSTHFKVVATGEINNVSHTIVAVFEKLNNDKQAPLLIRYWNDNAFEL